MFDLFIACMFMLAVPFIIIGFIVLVVAAIDDLLTKRWRK